MTLDNYIASVAQLREQPKYQWSDWKCRDYYMWDADEDYLADISDAAAFGLLLATASFIRQRFFDLDRDPRVGYLLDAGWAYMLEPSACVYYEPSDQDWVGPVRAPLAVMIVILMDAIYCRGEDPEIRTRTFWMANLARYVLESDAEAFDAWFEWAASRMQSLHPRHQTPELGLFDVAERFEPAVGPGAFDPNSSYAPSQARAEIFAELRAADQSNLFVSFENLKP